MDTEIKKYVFVTRECKIVPRKNLCSRKSLYFLSM